MLENNRALAEAVEDIGEARMDAMTTIQPIENIIENIELLLFSQTNDRGGLDRMSVAASQTDSVRDLSVAPSMANSSVGAISVAPSMVDSVAGISVAASVADSSAPMDTETDQEALEDTAKAMEEDIDEYLDQVAEHTTHLVAIIDQSRDWTGKLPVHPPVLDPPPFIKPLTPAMLTGALPNEDQLGFGPHLLYAQHRAWRITWEEMQLGPNERSDDGVHCWMNGCKYSHVIPVPRCSRAKCWKHVHAGCGCAPPWYNLGGDTNIFCDAGCRLLALRQGEFERMETTPILNPATAAVARMSRIPPEFMNKLVTTYCRLFPISRAMPNQPTPFSGACATGSAANCSPLPQPWMIGG
jgi:hypothetical protein